MLRSVYELGSRSTNVHPQVACVGSFPPRECGIATFTADVAAALDAQSSKPVKIVAMDEPGAACQYPPQVQWRIQQNDPNSYLQVAATLNRSDVDIVNIQHEYGLFGGEDGAMLIPFMDALRQPIVTTLHTVLPEPTGSLRAVTQQICARSAAVVVLARSAVTMLRDIYGVDERKVQYIPHGIPTVPRRPGMRRAMKNELGFSGRTLLSTFGLIGRSKGIEYVLQALPPLVEKYPSLLYLVLGETHPGVRRHEGEQYREYLQSMVQELGLQHHVQFENRYLGLEELVNYLLATDVYLMPYLDPNQIVSGTLAYAVGCGKAVIATPFRYAQELLSDNRGVIVPFHAPGATSKALDALLGNEVLRATMEARAYAFSRPMEWPNVATAYREVFNRFWTPTGRPVSGVTPAVRRVA